MMNLAGTGDLILSAVLTRRCRYCGEFVRRTQHLCDDCRDNVSVISGERCKHCGTEKKRCGCKGHRMKYDGITAPFYYEGSAKAAVLRLKFSRKDYFAHILASDMAKSVLTEFENVEFDFIAYVPFTVRQKRLRIYNQSALIAERLSFVLKIPLQNVLVKNFETGVQHSLRGHERTGNVAGVYDVSFDADVKGKTVLLVDDIKTTGATLNECAKVLKIRGAERVYCVTAALSGKKVKENADESEVSAESSA